MELGGSVGTEAIKRGGEEMVGFHVVEEAGIYQFFQQLAHDGKEGDWAVLRRFGGCVCFGEGADGGEFPLGGEVGGGPGGVE